MSDPWFKFYPTDWRQDPCLRICSLAARGLWIEMIALMHQSSPYGHLLVSDLSPTDAQLAALVGCPSEQVPHLLGELEAAGVFSRTRSGVIYSRKMTRMQKKAATARNNGRKGGNPTLGKQTENPALDNPEVNPEVKPQKLEARSQNISIPNGMGDAAEIFTKEVFDRGVAYLGRSGVAERQARALIGKWRKDADDAQVFSALAEANRNGVTDPVAWITARLTKATPQQADLSTIFANLRAQ